jgi:hypothetical protein
MHCFWCFHCDPNLQENVDSFDSQKLGPQFLPR